MATLTIQALPRELRANLSISAIESFLCDSVVKNFCGGTAQRYVG